MENNDMNKKQELQEQDISGKEPETDGENYMGLGLCLGMCLGLSIGKYIFHSMALGMSMGMCLGLAIGSSISRKK